MHMWQLEIAVQEEVAAEEAVRVRAPVRVRVPEVAEQAAPKRIFMEQSWKREELRRRY